MGRVIHKKETEQEKKPGLYVISTPIGNLQDLSLRAKKILEQCELVLAEDTRLANKLFNSFNINKKKNQLLSCYRFNETERIISLTSKNSVLAWLGWYLMQAHLACLIQVQKL